MSLGVNPASAMQSFVSSGGSFNMMKLTGHKLQYKPVVDGQGIGQFSSYSGGMDAAAKHVASLAAKQGEIMGIQSMMGGYNSVMGKKPTMFHGKDSYSSAMDQLTFNDGNLTHSQSLVPIITNAFGETIASVLISEGVKSFFDWVEGLITPWMDTYAIYVGGRLVGNINMSEVPNVVRSYRRRGLRVQLKRSKRYGPRAVIRPRTRAHNVNF
jgi:hypothetical protein